MRAQAIHSCPIKGNQSITNEQADGILKALDSFAKRSQAATIENDPKLLRIIKVTIDSIKSNNPNMDDKEIFSKFLKGKFHLVNKVRSKTKAKSRFGGVI